MDRNEIEASVIKILGDGEDMIVKLIIAIENAYNKGLRDAK